MLGDRCWGVDVQSLGELTTHSNRARGIIDGVAESLHLIIVSVKKPGLRQQQGKTRVTFKVESAEVGRGERDGAPRRLI